MSLIDRFKALTAARAAAEQSVEVLDHLREEIAGVKADVARIERAPQPVAAAMQAFDQWAQRAATAGVDSLRVYSLLHPEDAEKGLTLPVVTVGASSGPQRDYDAATKALLGLLLVGAMPALRKTIEGQLQDLTAGVECMTPETRRKKLAAAQKRLLGLELQEETAVRAFEGMGIAVQRRGDADPRALLAADESLPAA